MERYFKLLLLIAIIVLIAKFTDRKNLHENADIKVEIEKVVMIEKSIDTSLKPVSQFSHSEYLIY